MLRRSAMLEDNETISKHSGCKYLLRTDFFLKECIQAQINLDHRGATNTSLQISGNDVVCGARWKIQAGLFFYVQGKESLHPLTDLPLYYTKPVI